MNCCPAAPNHLFLHAALLYLSRPDDRRFRHCRRVPVGGGCAVALTARELDRVGDQIADRVDEQVAERVEQRLRAVLHEIRQPLSAVFALAEMARGLPGNGDELQQCLDRIIEQSGEVSAAAANVLDLGAAESPQTCRVDVDEVLDSVIDTFRLIWGGTLQRRGDRGPLYATGSRATLRRCVVNLVDNAVRAAGPAGRVTVSAHRGPGEVRVLIEDDGPGFGRIPTRSGLGLGLTRQALESLGGRMSLGLPSGTGGARVAFSLPVPVTAPSYRRAPVRAG
jgi:signal transduction histidine kinase